MSPTVEQLVERAWRALWREGSPYHVPTAVQHGRLSGHVRVRPLASLPLTDVSDVVLFDRAPWGGVSVSLRKSRLEGLSSIAESGCTFDPSTGIITAGITFPGLRLTGAHVLQAGQRTGAAVAAAFEALRPNAVVDDDSNITLAKSYQSQLIGMESDSGRFMVANYYENNDTYTELFQTMPNFVKVWANHTTNAQTTQFYANQTSNAAQPENINTVSVNGQPDAQGFSPYNAHSFFMQNFVMGTCFTIANHYGTQTEIGKRYNKAGTGAQNFAQPTLPQSQTAQTVSQVLTTVANSTPPSENAALKINVDEPQWLKDVRAKALAMAEQVVQTDLIDSPINTKLLARPVRGDFSGTVPPLTLTLSGRIAPDGPDGAPAVVFSGCVGLASDVGIVLSNVDTDLGAEVGAALERARFLKRLLGHRALTAITSPTVLQYLSRQMNLALAQRLGATG